MEGILLELPEECSNKPVLDETIEENKDVVD